MACYMFVVGVISDMDKFMATYQSAVEPLIAKHGGTYMMRGGPLEVLEGNFGAGGGMVLSVWPSRQAAMDFWTSDEYQPVKAMRKDLGQFQVILFDGENLV